MLNSREPLINSQKSLRTWTFSISKENTSSNKHIEIYQPYTISDKLHLAHKMQSIWCCPWIIRFQDLSITECSLSVLKSWEPPNNKKNILKNAEIMILLDAMLKHNLAMGQMFKACKPLQHSIKKMTNLLSTHHQFQQLNIGQEILDSSVLMLWYMLNLLLKGKIMVSMLLSYR